MGAVLRIFFLYLIDNCRNFLARMGRTSVLFVYIVRVIEYRLDELAKGEACTKADFLNMLHA